MVRAVKDLEGAPTAPNETCRMIIKSADDQSKRLALLQDLKQSARLDADQKDWLDKQLRGLRPGIQGEKDAAHYIDTHFRELQNRMVIHDLRVEIDGVSAQIDHLVINRLMNVTLLETKNFGGNVTISDRGEFSVKYSSGEVYGIESPLEQSKRHEVTLRKLFDQLGIVGRLGLKPIFHHCVLLHPRAIIKRPSPTAFDTSMVMKADQFNDWYTRYVNQEPTMMETAAQMLRIRGADTIEDFARRIAEQHKPKNPLELPEFMRPRLEARVVPHVPRSRHSRGGDTAVAERPVATTGRFAPKAACATCGAKLTPRVSQYCQDYPKRFGGLQYCMVHQEQFPRI